MQASWNGPRTTPNRTLPRSRRPVRQTNKEIHDQRTFILPLTCSRILPAIAIAASLSSTSQAQSSDTAVKLNQIQVIGTHNSYHSGIAPNEVKLWQQGKYADAYKGLDYQH